MFLLFCVGTAAATGLTCAEVKDVYQSANCCAQGPDSTVSSSCGTQYHRADKYSRAYANGRRVVKDISVTTVGNVSTVSTKLTPLASDALILPSGMPLVRHNQSGWYTVDAAGEIYPNGDVWGDGMLIPRYINWCPGAMGMWLFMTAPFVLGPVVLSDGSFLPESSQFVDFWTHYSKLYEQEFLWGALSLYDMGFSERSKFYEPLSNSAWTKLQNPPTGAWLTAAEAQTWLETLFDKMNALTALMSNPYHVTMTIRMTLWYTGIHLLKVGLYMQIPLCMKASRADTCVYTSITAKEINEIERDIFLYALTGTTGSKCPDSTTFKDEYGGFWRNPGVDGVRLLGESCEGFVCSDC